MSRAIAETPGGGAEAGTVTVVRKVVKHGDEYWVTSEDGKKVLGKHKTKEDALKQLDAVEMSKHDRDMMDGDDSGRSRNPSDRERRQGDGVELRSAGEGISGPGTLVGYAARFDRLSEPLKDKSAGTGRKFREKVMRGAFTRTLRTADVRALFGHDENQVLGRNRASTLRMAEDENGLRVEIDLPDTTAGRDAAVSVARGDITGMSFGFYVPKGGDRWDRSGEMPIRSLHDIDIDDVSLVAYPAYPDTTVALRSLTEAEEEDEEDRDEEEDENAKDADAIADVVADETNPPDQAVLQQVGAIPPVPPLAALLSRLRLYEV